MYKSPPDGCVVNTTHITHVHHVEHTLYGKLCEHTIHKTYYAISHSIATLACVLYYSMRTLCIVAFCIQDDAEWLLPVSVAVSLSGIPHTVTYQADDIFDNASAICPDVPGSGKYYIVYAAATSTRIIVQCAQ